MFMQYTVTRKGFGGVRPCGYEEFLVLQLPDGQEAIIGMAGDNNFLPRLHLNDKVCCRSKNYKGVIKAFRDFSFGEGSKEADKIIGIQLLGGSQLVWIHPDDIVLRTDVMTELIAIKQKIALLCDKAGIPFEGFSNDNIADQSFFQRDWTGLLDRLVK